MKQENDLRRFAGGSQYVLDDELAEIVNISMALEMPLLLKGEPGTGKTMLAHAIAEALQMRLIVLNVKSSMKLIDALYQYDTLTRLNDSRFGDSKRDVSNIEEYIRMGKIGQSFVADERVVLLIDEIDKADTDFQDDMLDVLDQMQFDIIEIDKTITAKHRPIVIITSNAKKDLSDPFLGRCNFHHIAFPDPDMMKNIVQVHFPDIDKELLNSAVQAFYRLREIREIEKKPATRELINWIRALRADPDFRVKDLVKGRDPLSGGPLQEEPRLFHRPKDGRTTVRVNDRQLPMFVDFFYTLRQVGIPVTPTAFLRLHKALNMGLINSVNDFYTAARAILVKSERYFDLYDQVFAHRFQGVELKDPDERELSEIARALLEEWLQGSPQLLAKALGVDESELNKMTPEELIEYFLAPTQGADRGPPWRRINGSAPAGPRRSVTRAFTRAACGSGGYRGTSPPSRWPWNGAIGITPRRSL